MAEKSFTVLDLLDLDLKGHNSLNLRCVCGRNGLGREITLPDLNRPGLALSGFYESFGFQRVQVFGRGETAFLEKIGYSKIKKLTIKLAKLDKDIKLGYVDEIIGIETFMLNLFQ